MLQFTKVTKTYHLGETYMTVLHGVDLTIKQGEFIAIIGPSGSGKSTMMNVLGLLDTPSTGKFTFQGKNVNELSGNQKADIRLDAIGFVFQNFNLLPRMSAYKQVGLPLSYKGLNFNQRYKKAIQLLERVGLGDRVDHTPDMLSGGEQQRVAIARALANDPKLVLADEPTGALDTHTGAEVLKIFKELHDEGRTIVVITHDPDVASIAERVVHIRDGKIVSDEKNAKRKTSYRKKSVTNVAKSRSKKITKK